jgi:hypothetical protein
MPTFAETLRANTNRVVATETEAANEKAAADFARIKQLCLDHSLRFSTQEMCRLKMREVHMCAALRAVIEAEGIVIGEFEGDEDNYWTFSW